jgi:hypothetical protein
MPDKILDCWFVVRAQRIHAYINCNFHARLRN